MDIIDFIESFMSDEINVKKQEFRITPDYNIIKVDDKETLLEIFLPGYSREEIDVKVEKNWLLVNCHKKEKDERKYLVRKINNINSLFKRQLKEFEKVQKVKLENGVLSISVKEEIPESQYQKFEIE